MAPPIGPQFDARRCLPNPGRFSLVVRTIEQAAGECAFTGRSRISEADIWKLLGERREAAAPHRPAAMRPINVLYLGRAGSSNRVVLWRQSFAISGLLPKSVFRLVRAPQLFQINVFACWLLVAWQPVDLDHHRKLECGSRDNTASL